MNRQLGVHIQRRLALTAIMLVLSGMLSIPVANIAAAQTEQSAPSVGEIVVNQYVCETGYLYYHVPVSDLRVSPSLNSIDTYALATYEDGSSYTTKVGQYVSSVEAESFTGNWYFPDRFPTPNPESSGSGPITSIEITVSVGYGNGNGATDTSTLTYVPECGDTDDLVEQLIATLVAILESLLNE